MAVPVGSRPRGRFKLAAVGALVAVFGAVAFLLLGSASPGFDPIAQAATLSAQTPGYRMHMTFEISSPALGTPVTAQADGVVDLRDRASSLLMVMQLPATPEVTQALGGNTLTMDLVAERSVVYLKLPPALTAKLPSDKPWLKLDLGRLFNSAGLSGITSIMNNPMSSDPTSQLTYLRATSGDVVNEGRELVDGVVTTHYRADIDYGRLANVVPPAERAAVSQTASRLEALLHTDQEPVEVWIDHHHHIRRMTVTIDVNTAGGAGLQESMTADMTDYGPQSRPAPPPADQVQDITGLPGLGR